MNITSFLTELLIFLFNLFQAKENERQNILATLDPMLENGIEFLTADGQKLDNNIQFLTEDGQNVCFVTAYNVEDAMNSHFLQMT